MSKAARIVGTAFAPTAGANGGEFELAPSVHDMNRQATVERPTSAQKAAVT